MQEETNLEQPQVAELSWKGNLKPELYVALNALISC